MTHMARVAGDANGGGVGGVPPTPARALVNCSSAEPSEPPTSKADIPPYGHSPCRSEVAIYTGVNSGRTSPTLIKSIPLMFLDAL